MTLTYSLDSPILWGLVLVQLTLGFFDVFYHHEFTQRLPWRNTATKELYLHSARNLFYAVLFGCFAWWQPHGLFASLIAFLLVAEIFITLWDFVEEDRSRPLPASERLTHTLLALNYGAMLVLVLPVLVQKSGLTTQMVYTQYGFYHSGNIILSIAAIGCFVLAIRDYLMTKNTRNLTLNPAAALAEGLKDRHRIVITGGTGFIGARLAAALSEAGHAVIVLTRSTKTAMHLTPPFTVVTNLDQIPSHLPIDVIVNLAGMPIVAKRWSPRFKKVIINSRLQTTQQVEHFIKRLDHKPEVLIGASAIGFYGLRGDEWLTEDDKGKPAFTHDVTDGIELANEVASYKQCRLVNLRIGLVLGHSGGPLSQLLPIYDWGLGGPIGTGKQWMSWIERDDMVRLIIHAIATKSLNGAVNAVTPHPVTNKDFAKTLGTVMARPAFLPMPSFMVKLLFGQMGEELLLSGQRVSAQKLQDSGFAFRYPTLSQALLYGTGKNKPVKSQHAVPKRLALQPNLERIERKI